ncbi:succinyl-diaminopimelate desuccinylase [Acidihalobacter aeolianus]|nr:succinyl-diaminopimelate desuccinylase [Acidihalobacter aeolianus]
MSATLELTIELVSRSSMTPEDAGCQQLIAQRLERLGFVAQHLRFGEVDNLWLRRGNDGPVFCFAGHTDVVPTGPLEKWNSPPFVPTVRDGMLYGRGTADMKGSIAAMVTAIERFIAANPDSHGSIALLLTSDEEGPAVNGTVKVVETLQQRGERIDWCIVGEPSSTAQVGDVIKNGRRGSLTGRLRIQGKQGHIAYPHLAENPIHLAAPALEELIQTEWDTGNAYFPPTSFQISNIHAGTGAGNIIPGEMDVEFNFRYSTQNTAHTLQQRVEETLQRHSLKYELQWIHSGSPFLTPPGNLVNAVCAAASSVNQISPSLSTAGGTSDGRFIAPMGAQVVELGPVNDSIHQIDEHVDIDSLDALSLMYERTLEMLFLASAADESVNSE